MSIFNGIKENDIVRIKFKEFKEMYTDLDSLNTLIDDYLGYNMKAIFNGGMFVVNNGPEMDMHRKKEFIDINNHLDNSGSFNVYEEFVEKIEVITDVPTFRINGAGLLIVRLDNQLVINGHDLKNREYDPYAQQAKSASNSNVNSPKVNGDLSDFKSFIEQWLIDVATEEVMSEDDEENEKEK